MQKSSEPVPLIARAGDWARWEMLTLLGLLSVYVALAAYKIHFPGIYYDEILSLAPAAAEKPYLKCFGLPLLVFPYIGALKSWIYTPIFALLALVAIAIALVAVGLLVLWVVYPILQRPHTRGFSGRFSLMWSLYESMSTGAATAYMWFKSVPTVPSWTGWSVLIVTAIFLLLTLVNYCLRASTNKNIDTRTLKFCLWSLLMFGIIFVEIVVTPQAGGPPI